MQRCASEHRHSPLSRWSHKTLLPTFADTAVSIGFGEAAELITQQFRLGKAFGSLPRSQTCVRELPLP